MVDVAKYSNGRSVTKHVVPAEIPAIAKPLAKVAEEVASNISYHARFDAFNLRISVQEQTQFSVVFSMAMDPLVTWFLNESGLEVEEAKKQPEIFQTLKESFMKAFKVMDRELKMSKNIDCFCSGTTSVTLINQGSDLVIGNIGDSRAILATRDEDNSLIAVQLTVDLKLYLPAEAERIRKCKGRVFALRDEPEVTGVWLPNFDSPGLAMTRAFGI